MPNNLISSNPDDPYERLNWAVPIWIGCMKDQISLNDKTDADGVAVNYTSAAQIETMDQIMSIPSEIIQNQLNTARNEYRRAISTVVSTPGMWSPEESARQVSDALGRQIRYGPDHDMNPFKNYKMFKRR